MKVRALALDLGSTRLKLAALHEDGSLQVLGSRAFPALTGSGPIREADPLSFRDRVTALFQKATSYPKTIPLGISVQRSSFLLWHRHTGKPLTRILSWQDRRAQAWCDEQRALRSKLWRLTGLPLSTHYAGPKLAFLLSQDRWLAALARSGQCCFGTLETYLTWVWSGGEVFQTDPSMAARTQLMALDDEDWSEEILAAFAIPKTVLPKIQTFENGEVRAPGGWPIAAIIADQTAASLPLFRNFANAAVLNTGTGSFALRLGQGRAPTGYLTGHIGQRSNTELKVFWEGPVNAGASLWRRLKHQLTANGFAVSMGFAAPERQGWAAPYWRGDLGQICTESHASEEIVAQLFFEGYAFRLRQVIGGLFEGQSPACVLLGGGLTHDKEWVERLACYLPWTLYRLEEPEMSLWGAGWLADKQVLTPEFPISQVTSTHDAVDEGHFQAWLAWMDQHHTS